MSNKIAILGTGNVGNVIGSKMIQLGYEVKMGSRTANNEKAVNWTKNNGAKAGNGTFEEAAKFADIIFNCTSGQGTMDALKLAGAENLKGKIIIDLANTLDFSKGMPPTLTIVNKDSLGELIQRTYPEVKVVKTLNTMNCNLMMNPSLVAGDHNVFVSGNDDVAKLQVKKLLSSIGWKEHNIIDLGDISTARGTEQLLPIWLRLYGKMGHANFNFNVVAGEAPKK
jgi:predicted dinucleotide-binding enzyme